ncbi:MAG: DUF4870 domain-containing protein [Nocardioidaceae bacterium]|nr:DUF4870 domain-containing protein [Nocardioidaceae bacterium]
MSNESWDDGSAEPRPAPSPGWYPDPTGQGSRWWDGHAWGPPQTPGPAPTGYGSPAAPPYRSQSLPPTHELYRGPGGAEQEASWAVWSHLGPLLVVNVGGLLTAGVLSLVGWVFPLVVMNTVGSRSPRVRREAVESLNFQLSWLLYSLGFVFLVVVVAILTLGLGLFVVVPILLLLWVCEIALNIIGTVRANRPEPWRYPAIIRFVS